MLYKPLVSLVMMFVTASSVTAFAILPTIPLERRGGGYIPSATIPTVPASECNSGGLQCCDTTSINSGNSAVGSIGGVIGQGCTPIVGSPITCRTNPICCQNFEQNGIVNVACTPVNVNL
ncbi:hypothetical protein BGW80DRAFT_830890 [Lactifluus volemus]|nr:hypothetical protein BGW80DRAFT_830890 [Lactifluus volemus]